MKAYNLILAAALILTAVSCEPNIPSNDNPDNPDIPSVTPGDGNIVMQWENEPQRVCPGAYARVHRLNDGRYMLVYSSGSDGYLRFSTDGCLTWSQPSKVFIAKNFTSEAGMSPTRSSRSSAPTILTVRTASSTRRIFARRTRRRQRPHIP